MSLPREDFMVAAKSRWEAMALPPLDLQSPWYGYPLTMWTQRTREEAELALTGRYLETGTKLMQRRASVE